MSTGNAASGGVEKSGLLKGAVIALVAGWGLFLIVPTLMESSCLHPSEVLVFKRGSQYCLYQRGYKGIRHPENDTQGMQVCEDKADAAQVIADRLNQSRKEEFQICLNNSIAARPTRVLAFWQRLLPNW